MDDNKQTSRITLICTHSDGPKNTITFSIPESNYDEFRRHLYAFVAICDHLSKFEEDERFG